MLGQTVNNSVQKSVTCAVLHLSKLFNWLHLIRKVASLVLSRNFLFLRIWFNHLLGYVFYSRSDICSLDCKNSVLGYFSG
jgi:hypothetical protein